jgi:hypothetical protein
MDEIIGSYEYKQDGDLRICEQQGCAYQENTEKSIVYGEEYFNKYKKYEKNDISKKITKGRVELTEKYCKFRLFDIGIGSGYFMEQSNLDVLGYDINPLGKQLLIDKNKFLDAIVGVKSSIFCGVTFWDSLEHIPNPGEILWSVLSDTFVFVSIPIFEDLLKIRDSKHFRPNEHYYYFTKDGLIYYFEQLDYNLIRIDDFEIQAGREDIYTFTFQKK